jgi:hypothetical protein
MPTSLTQVKVEAKIDGKPLDADISLLSVRYALKVNEVAECQLAVGAKSKAGISKLRELFPVSGVATYYSKAEVTIKGNDTRYSTIKDDIKLFKGYVVGYGNQKQHQDLSMTLNLRGPFFKLQQIPLMAPGFHTSSPYSFSIAPISYAGSSQNGTSFSNFRNNLIAAASTKEDGFEVYRIFVSRYEEALKSASTSRRGTTKVFPAAITAFGFAGGAGESVLSEELGFLKTYGNTNLDFAASATDKKIVLSNYLRTLVDTFASNPSATFWEFLLHILSQFGLNIISLGEFIAGVPKIPLLLPPDNNIIHSKDITQMTVGDFPFFSPTRCIVSIQDALGYNNSRTKPSSIFGEYPNTTTPTEQEAATGVFASYLQAPSFLGCLRASKELRSFISDVKLIDGTKKASGIKSKLQPMKKAMAKNSLGLKEFASLYAKYLLMTKKCSQRTGEVVTRFNPYILPGFPALIKDPLGVADIFCRVREVNHVLDCKFQQATSVISVDHVRYGGELDEHPFPNPLYSSFKADVAAKSILSDMGM